MEHRVLPTGYFFILLILIVGVHFTMPAARVIPPPYNWAGIILILFGLVMNVWADNLFKKKMTTVRPYQEPTSLVTHGPFRLSRHPMYLGMAAILSGTSVVSRSLISLVFPVIFVVLMQKIFIPSEESVLESIFGNKYIYYKKKVRRWI